MSAQAQQSSRMKSIDPAKAIGAGIAGGLAGGIAFGVLMGMMGMLPMVGMLVGQQNAGVGMAVHLVISALIGAVYGLVVARLRLPLSAQTAWVGGALNGVFWWVLGALVVMPALLGMPDMVFVIGQPQWMSMLGHLIYGVLAAFVFNAIAQR